jgi:hypothetical protein
MEIDSKNGVKISGGCSHGPTHERAKEGPGMTPTAAGMALYEDTTEAIDRRVSDAIGQRNPSQ